MAIPLLTRVSLICFAASYAVVFVLEIARLSTKIRLRMRWVWLWAGAGLLVHTAYLFRRAQEGIAARGVALSSWYHWCLIAAWAIALIYLLISMSRPKSSVGLFLVPLILALIGLARAFPSTQLFEARKAASVWGMLHGIGLLLGTVTVLVGFAAGLMYLVQSSRLKRKISPRRGIRLPSLEWLERANERCLVWSAFFLTSGILAGVVLNLIKSRSASGLAWTDPAVQMSMVLFVWVLAMTGFSFIYKPARVGRKVAYLTVASFVILALTLALVLFGPSEHIPTISLGMGKSPDLAGPGDRFDSERTLQFGGRV